MALADAAGAVQTEYTYEPFGRTTATGVSNANPFQYTGRENDGTGLHYYRARYYQPGLQRFISEDPIEFEGGDVNLYVYVANNPILYLDPEGLTHAQRLGECRTLAGCVDGRGKPKPPPPPKPGKPVPEIRNAPPADPICYSGRCGNPEACTLGTGVCIGGRYYPNRSANPVPMQVPQIPRPGRPLPED